MTYAFQRGIDAIAFRFAAADLESVRNDLQELAAMSTDANTFAGLDDAALDVLGRRERLTGRRHRVDRRARPGRRREP